MEEILCPYEEEWPAGPAGAPYDEPQEEARQ
jgi:hypothetical protein